ncbi:FAD-dependent monooxygenase [Saccharothrix syringae]|uniref:NcmL n=1 Tax=Saccharothrix syringae TaxID=103733 RepID=A0A1X9WEL8_SACSY|nr:FAD-dependent monooxygenase [Saccharothrix syringae]ARS01465.1 NcmL [Saccharothrix syringae]QFZ19269.1 hypothetical protein EKG83_19115 [Saccharothrix syringae]
MGNIADKVPVLIAGAGPTGLTLAIDLARRGIPALIIDKDSKPSTASRGKAGIQPRSLEVFDDLGVVDEVVAAGTQRLPFRRFTRDRLVGEAIPYLHHAPTHDLPYRRLLFLPQSRVEQVLRDRLAALGGAVEAGVELVGFTRGADAVTATLSTPTGLRSVTADYLVGCDGGRSTVRKALDLPFRGHTETDRRLLVGDVEVDGLEPDAWYQWLDLDRGVVMLCPLSGTRSWQVQVTPPRDADGNERGPSVEAFQAAVDHVTGMPIRLSNATWLSTTRVNVRMVDRMRVGRVLLAGDAAHVHPVLGALGANTGIQDAYNLGWKLARALRDGPDCLALDSYERERLPVAEWTLKTSVASRDLVLAAMLAGTGGAEAGLTEETLQLGLGYRDGPLSAQLVEAGAVRAGDRAPDSPCLDPAGRPLRLFDAQRGPHFTLFGFGPGSAAAVRAAADAGVADLRAHLVPDHPPAYGLTGDALVLVRPDGHVGLVGAPDDFAAVHDYLSGLSRETDRPNR